MKKVISLVLVLLMALSFTSALAEEDTIIIGFANNASHETMLEQMEAFQDYVDEWNAAGNTPKLQAAITTAESSVEKQIADVEALIELGCKVIYLHAVDLVGLIPAVDACNAAGVMVLEARGMDYEGVTTTFNGCDEPTLARYAFGWFSEKLDADPDLVLKMGIQYGVASQTVQMIRIDVLVDLLKEKYPDRVEVLASLPCDFDAQKGMECMENWLQMYPGEMNCVISAGAMMSCGAMSALVAAGEDMDDWIVTGFDATADVLWSINEGQVDMSVGIASYAGGWAAAEACRMMVMGEFTGDEYIAEGDLYCTIDSTNIADWYKDA